MTKSTTQVIILAAGKSSRFNTGKSKLLEKICGQEMVIYLTKLLTDMHIPITAVVGFQQELIKDVINRNHPHAVTFVEQHEQLGTGHALLCSKSTWDADNILVINGDMPLITQDTINALIQQHHQKDAVVSFVIAHQTDPSVGAYGRLINNNGVVEIVEARDFTGDPQEHCYINAGIYLIKRTYLEHAITALKQNTNSREFYITDLIKQASLDQLPVETVLVSFDCVRGINTIEELWAAEQIKKSDLIRHWMDNGVRFYAAHNLHIEADVHIGAGTVIGCGVHLLRGTKIGKHCKINEMVSIYSSVIGDEVTVQPYTLITDTVIGDRVTVGPFAHIHHQTIVAHDATIGNFVEVKNSSIGAHTKAKHLSYLGDATLGNNVNIGAGTITCNYDGEQKHQTTIQDSAFIGSNNTLVAPITIGENAYTAAGSTITENVPNNTLAFGRARQVNKEHYTRTSCSPTKTSCMKTDYENNEQV